MANESRKMQLQRAVKRVVIKVGTSSLTDEAGRIYQPKMWAIARAIAHMQQSLNVKVVLVSSGAGAVGRERLGLNLPLTMPEQQAAAAVGQALLILDWAKAFAPLPVAQLLLTSADIQDRQRYVNAKNALDASLKFNIVPIINENDSVTTTEIKFGDNDTLSAWAAYLANAEILIILTDVDGLYTADPRISPNAKRIEKVSNFNEVTHLAGKAGTGRGTGGMVTKLRAAKIASEAGIDTIIIGGGGKGLEALVKSQLDSKGLGTHFIAKAQQSARKAWIAQQPSKGDIYVDKGASDALKKGRSLLPSGITKVLGEFRFGDAISVKCDALQIVARGLSNYSSEALDKIKGLRSQEITKTLGYKDYDEAIHRDNLVLL